MPTFETFMDRGKPVRTQPVVAIQRRGIASLNRAAFDALKGARAVELLFDPDERIMGLRGVNPGTLHAAQVRKQPGADTYLIGVHSFAKRYGIPTDRARRYYAQLIDGGILAVNLSQEADNE